MDEDSEAHFRAFVGARSDALLGTVDPTVELPQLPRVG
jgi:hypothetical protein